MPQTPDVVQALFVGGVLRGTLNPQPYKRRILKISFVNAPRGSNFTLYRGFAIIPSAVMTTAIIGNRNSYDASSGSAPMELFAGEAATLVWSGSGVTALLTATATLISEWGR